MTRNRRDGRLAQTEQSLSNPLTQAPWMDQSRSFEERARATLAEMTANEKMPPLAPEPAPASKPQEQRVAANDSTSDGSP